MEVRCGSCNKLFRVADDKITGRGIKFPCTRCGEYVRITQEDLRNYTLSRNTASALDLFDIKNDPAAPMSPEAAAPVSSDAATIETGSTVFKPAAPSAFEDKQEEKAPPFIEPAQSLAASMPEPDQAVEHKPEPLMMMKKDAEASDEPLPVPREEPKPLIEIESKDIASPPLPDQPSTQEPEAPHPPVSFDPPPAEQTAEEPVYASTPSRAGTSHIGKWMLILFGALIILGLTAYGVFMYLKPSLQEKVEAPVQELTSIEGLQVVNPVGTIDANGDLVVIGTIENATNMDRSDWYIVLEVYDAQGVVLSKIRLLNGNQIYSRRDYDILAKRGANVQELKDKLLKKQGIIVPRQGKVKFEARYVQPPPAIASFVAQVLPFDRVQLDKEIVEEMK
jgi:hypothetical protein